MLQVWFCSLTKSICCKCGVVTSLPAQNNICCKRDYVTLLVAQKSKSCKCGVQTQICCTQSTLFILLGGTSLVCMYRSTLSINLAMSIKSALFMFAWGCRSCSWSDGFSCYMQWFCVRVCHIAFRLSIIIHTWVQFSFIVHDVANLKSKCHGHLIRNITKCGRR